MIVQKQKQQGELIYGVHPLIELLKAKRRKVISIYTTKPTPKQWSSIEKLLPAYPVAIQYVERDVLSRMVSTTDHQGIVAWVQEFSFRKKPFDPKKHQFLLLLDSIQDQRNLGAILRSAYCTGVDGVIMTSKNSAPLHGVALKSSAGLAEYLEIQQVNSIVEALEQLKKAGYVIYLATLDGQNAVSMKFTLPACVVIGNEAVGISKSVFRFGTQVTLPQKTADTSYNASVAAGILLFMISSQKALI